MTLIRQFGAIDVSTLSTGYEPYEFCLPQSDVGHRIQADQILAVKYVGGDSINRIDVRRSNIGSGPDYGLEPETENPFYTCDDCDFILHTISEKE